MDHQRREQLFQNVAVLLQKQLEEFGYSGNLVAGWRLKDKKLLE
jgi:hypothetical protein